MMRMVYVNIATTQRDVVPATAVPIVVATPDVYFVEGKDELF